MIHITEVKKNSVYDYLYNAIRTGDIKPGQTLTERELAEKIGVSRTPVREAIRKLEEQGLVTHVPHKGVKVATLTMEKVAQLYEVREVLEGLAARTLSQIQTPEIIDELNSYVAKAEKEAAANNIKELADINSEFHLALTRLSENFYLEAIMTMLQTQIGLMMSTSLSQAGRPLRNVEEHKMMISAIQSGDGDVAESMARFHVRKAKENAFKKIAEGGNG
ncbi:GntR family transcriptional regulator [Planococcus shenhongbingii]|uniref:GntR family transcriptional regulator n=1 Tax=Planococcus shenhongbingii TaxID=3058398 RepID=UPI002624C587|nr:GntR family transcriptional regulator [Planococcus sp. N016]WKA58389.1 GntR family transcriptional regulator [Planococcus sp. N016]